MTDFYGHPYTTAAIGAIAPTTSPTPDAGSPTPDAVQPTPDAAQPTPDAAIADSGERDATPRDTDVGDSASSPDGAATDAAMSSDKGSHDGRAADGLAVIRDGKAEDASSAAPLLEGGCGCHVEQLKPRNANRPNTLGIALLVLGLLFRHHRREK